MDRYDSDWDQENRGRSTDRAYQDERERRRRRNSRRARREQELRRKKRMALVIALIALACVVFVVVAAAGRNRSQKEETDLSAASAETAGNAETASAEEASLADTEESSTQEETQNLPYVFKETENTVQLGKSLTDISIYDDQRHVTTSSSSSSSENSEEGASQAGEDGEATSSADASSAAEDAAKAPDYVDSQYAILVNTDTGEILAERNPYDRIVPASMTKVMTLLVAVEHMENPEENLKDKVTITQEICDESYRSGSSFVGYGVGDEATVEDLLYGAILPSGADAAMALAEYTAGSQEAFAEMMNEKAKELGISDTTHFTNCVGLYDEDHYSTVYDMSVIMRAAIDNDLCREVLSKHTWTTGATMDHPEGIEISNWFLRRIEDHDTNGTVVCGKTGFVNESGNCAVSYQEGNSGTGYIACTALTYNQWRSIYDHVALYKTYTK